MSDMLNEENHSGSGGGFSFREGRQGGDDSKIPPPRKKNLKIRVTTEEEEN